METKQAEERQVEPQKHWREEGVENARAEHRPCSEKREVQRDKRSEGQAEEQYRGSRERDKRTFVPGKEGGGEGETGRNCYCKKRTTNTSAGLPAENSVSHPFSLTVWKWFTGKL